MSTDTRKNIYRKSKIIVSYYEKYLTNLRKNDMMHVKIEMEKVKMYKVHFDFRFF